MLRNLVIKSRSYRSFKEDTHVSKETLTRFIETARLCPSAVNKQPLKYKLVYEREDVDSLLALTKWGGLLRDVTLPPAGHHPTAFIVICCDTSVCEDTDKCKMDVGIVSQTIMLQAAEEGIGGCMLGAFDANLLSHEMLIPKKHKPMLILAFGIPDETVLICDIPASGKTDYFRDNAGLHFVPKRKTEDIIIE